MTVSIVPSQNLYLRDPLTEYTIVQGIAKDIPRSIKILFTNVPIFILYYATITEQISMNLDNFFSAKNIAIVGVSRDPRKVGHVIFRNFIDGGYKGKIFVVNPNAEDILNHKAYKSILNIKERIDLAIIAVPADVVEKVVNECGKKKISDVIIITSGFKEVGDMELDKKLEQALKRNKIRCIGPNCLGTFDAYTKLDSLFLPRYRLQRPQEGNISFICQSGAVGSSILDLATDEGYGFSKFCSYGNAMNIDESDILEYFGSDEKTKVICMYIEGVKDGKKFLDVANRVSKKKPIIVLKGGKTEEGSKATMSHTGALAGSYEDYAGKFKQTGVIEVFSLEEMFEAAKILEKTIKPKGDRILVITNGGGYGILSTDAIIKAGIRLAEFSRDTKGKIKTLMPRVAPENPIDLLGDANTEGYKVALNLGLADKSVDIILLIVLYQTPLVTTDIVDVIIEANNMHEKPIIVVSAGGEFTEVLKKNVESNNVPTYTYPENAVRSIRHLIDYYGK
ncbi:MAG: CoA-binding protein [Candidatus Aenigmarchaeota archaeon]|nr:CoA-binding protein [Candidatus Aenigmarchaeota archaeon]